MQLKMTIDEIHALLDGVWPAIGDYYRITELSPGTATIVFQTRESDLRPGGTISGPTVFTVADLAFYLATLAVIGPEALTVTTNLSVNFMRKAQLGPLRGEARVLKLGRSLSVGDVMVYSDVDDALIAHASVTYSIPPKR